MSKVCAFFGNDSPLDMNDKLKQRVQQSIVSLIEQHDVDTFIVGQQGAFEMFTYQIVAFLQKQFPQIKIILAISYARELHNHTLPYNDFYYPPQAEKTPRRWCISQRNNWIISHCDFIIAYNRYQGRAYKLCERARKKGVVIMEEYINKEAS